MTITISAFWISIFTIVGIIAIVIAIALFLLHSYGGIKLFVKKDESIANKFLDKFPLVSPEFYKKPLKEQNAENNQEIHILNTKIEDFEQRFDRLEYFIQQLNITQSMSINNQKK